MRPRRLVLDWVHCRRARERGAWISINPGAHSIESLEDLEYGVAVARRGWREAGHVLDAQPPERVRGSWAGRTRTARDGARVFLEEIRKAGLFRAAAKVLDEKHGGRLPSITEEFPGSSAAGNSLSRRAVPRPGVLVE